MRNYQTSPPKGLQPQSFVTAKELFQESKRGNTPVPLLNRSNSCLNDVRESERHILTTHNGDKNIPSNTITIPQIEKRLVKMNKPMNCFYR